MADPENDGMLAAILLDGELDGVTFAEAYGRYRRAIHEFPDFDVCLVCFRDVVFVFMFRYVSIFDTRSPFTSRGGG